MEIEVTDILMLSGAVPAAAMVTGLVEIAKRLTRHRLDGWEPQLAAVLSALLVMAAMAVWVDANAAAGIAGWVAAGWIGISAWYGITRIAMGIHDEVTRRDGSLTGGS